MHGVRPVFWGIFKSAPSAFDILWVQSSTIPNTKGAHAASSKNYRNL